jgi:hypothetical protein
VNAGRDILGWLGDSLTAAASLVVVIGGAVGARYLRRANLRISSASLSVTSQGWLLTASAEFENRGFFKLSFRRTRDGKRPSLTVAEAVDLPEGKGTGRQIREVRTWVADNLDADLVDPGEVAPWTWVFRLPAHTASTVGYRVTCRVPVKWSIWNQILTWLPRPAAWLGFVPPDALYQWWEAQTFVPLTPELLAHAAHHSAPNLDETKPLKSKKVPDDPLPRDGRIHPETFYMPSTPTYADTALLAWIEHAEAQPTSQTKTATASAKWVTRSASPG